MDERHHVAHMATIVDHRHDWLGNAQDLAAETLQHLSDLER